MDENNGLEVTMPDMTTQKKRGPIIIFLLVLLFLGIGAYLFFQQMAPRGYQDYSIQKEQYYVEYSEEYDYWDVLTIEYPRLDGIKEPIQDQLNELLYTTAMNRANYWHFAPNEDVKKFQEEYFTIFCSDVRCDIPFHSQYLVSIDFKEIYAPGNPVWMTNLTERTLNLDLLTGETYDLSDILNINQDFITLWCQNIKNEQDIDLLSEDGTLNILLTWFEKSDKEWNEIYEFQPFFYVTEDKNFVVGISLDPKAEYTSHQPQNSTFYAHVDAQELASFRTDSEFWNKYEKSESVGTVMECPNREENLWLGEDAGIWNYWEERSF